MAVLKVLVYGDERLRKPSKEVSKISKKITALAKNLVETMYAYDGVGLAAPQVGENIRMFVIDVSPEGGPKKPYIFINPKIIKRSGASSCAEGCLSFPEVYADVRRSANVTVKALDLYGKPFVLEAFNGELLARAIQHEFDHLDGKLFVDHARNRFATDEELIAHNLPPIQLDYLLEEKELEEELAKNGEQKEA